MTDQYKYLETPEEAFAALLAQSKGGPVVEWLDSFQVWNSVRSSIGGWTLGSVVSTKFRVPLPPVVTVVYHVHDAEGVYRCSRDRYEYARDMISACRGAYIVKHTITNGVPSVEVVK